MTRYMTTKNSNVMNRRQALRLGCVAAVTVGAPGFVSVARGQDLTKLTYQTGWLPQPDKGGLYQAVATGIYKQHGLDVDVRKGGPQMNVNQIFLAGKADFADSDSFRAINFAKENLPAIAVAAFGQKSLNVLISHPGMGNDSLPALKGKPILVSTVGRQTYWLWLKAKFGFTDDQMRPSTFSLAPFLADKTLTTEGFITSEPLDVRKAGVQPVVTLLADHGYQNYSNVMLAQPRLVTEKPELVQRFVDATIKGWHSYLYGDPSPANALIKEGNPEMTDEKIAYAIATMKSAKIFESDDSARLGLGAMTDARWQQFYETMSASGALPAGLDVKKAYTTQFVNKRVGAA